MKTNQCLIFLVTVLSFHFSMANRNMTDAEKIYFCENNQLPNGLRFSDASNQRLMERICAQRARTSSASTRSVSPASTPASSTTARDNTPITPATTTPTPEATPSDSSPQTTGIHSVRQNPCSEPSLTSRLGTTHSIGHSPSNSASRYVPEINAGRIPSFLSQLVPVSMNLPQGRSCMGSNEPITICSMPDYLSVGNDQNFTHVRLGLSDTASVLRSLGFMLPTTRMVDTIYRQAQLRLDPITRTPDRTMTTLPVFENASAEARREIAGRNQLLTAGHMKDLVLTNRISNVSGRVAIYGLQRRSNGRPIQPLSTVHGASYHDYSHGIRGISQTAFVGGRSYRLEDLLRDSGCSSALSSEGAINSGLLQHFRSTTPAPREQDSPSTGTLVGV